MMGCHHRSPEEKIEYISSKIASKLDFNEQQKGILKEITEEFKKDFAEEKLLRKSKLADMQALLLSDTLDTIKVKALIKERQARMDQKVDKYIDKVASLHKTLTAEQKKEIIEKVQHFQDHFE